MGKASRSKRERREGGGQARSNLTPGAASRGGVGEPERRLPVFWIVIALVIVGGIVALVATAPDESTKDAVKAAADAPVYADVTVEGEELPRYPQSGTDDAVGKQVPTITGTGFDNVERTLVEEGTPTVIVVVAHWCPHCANEVPRIVEWAKDERNHEGINVIALSTAASKGQANYPPAEWLARERWPFDTIADDEADTANDALGVRGTPFMLFVKGDGTVLERASGELPDGEFDKAVQRLRDAE